MLAHENYSRNKEYFGARRSGEVREGGGFGFERGDGFDEARDGEGIADAARAADQAQHAAFAGQLDGDAHQRGDAGAIDLRDTVQDHDHSLRAALDHGLERVVKLLGGLTDSEPAVNFQDRYSCGFADVDFHGRPVSHGGASLYPYVGSNSDSRVPHGIIRWRVGCTK